MSIITIFAISIILLALSLFLYKKKRIVISKTDKLIIVLGALFLSVASLSVVVKKIGGTIMSTVHGWPHFYLTHQIKDVVDGTIIGKWNFVAGTLSVYPISNFIFYLSVVLFFYFVIRLLIKSEKKTTIGLLIIIVVLAIPLVKFQKIKELYIKQEIKQASYCQTDSDCEDAGGSCPFDCYSYINKNEAGRISRLINSYHSTCVYGCISCPTGRCENKKCEPVCEK